MTGLSSILPKPRAVSRSAKQRFLERDAQRRERAHQFFEELTRAREEYLTEHHVETATKEPSVTETAEHLLESQGPAKKGPVKPAVETPAAKQARSLTAEDLLSSLD